jgi:hypothetical protein
VTHVCVLRQDGCWQSIDWICGSRKGQEQAVDDVANLSRQIQEAELMGRDVAIWEILSAGFGHDGGIHDLRFVYTR